MPKLKAPKWLIEGIASNVLAAPVIATLSAIGLGVWAILRQAPDYFVALVALVAFVETLRLARMLQTWKQSDSAVAATTAPQGIAPALDKFLGDGERLLGAANHVLIDIQIEREKKRDHLSRDVAMREIGTRKDIQAWQARVAHFLEDRLGRGHGYFAGPIGLNADQYRDRLKEHIQRLREIYVSVLRGNLLA